MNKNIIKNIAIFIVSASAGYLLGYEISKNKYLKKADHEISSVKEAFKLEMNKFYGKQSAEKKEDDKPSTKKIKSKKDPEKGEDNDPEKEEIKKKYIDYGAPYRSKEDPDSKKEKSKKDRRIPYIISPDDYNNSDYEQHILMFFGKDKQLADEDYNIISNPEILVGPDALNSFGRYEEDRVLVRDDDKRIDYEIDLDNRSYKEAAPHGAESASKVDEYSPKVQLQDDKEESDDDDDK
jgi:hypothetical protein